MRISGLIPEAFRFSDWAFHRFFGDPPKDAPIVPIGRDISGLPVVYQGDYPSCLSCCVTFNQQWVEKTGVRLSWPFLAKNSGTESDGNVPSKVLDSARKQGICEWDMFQTPSAASNGLLHCLPSYFYIKDPNNAQAIYQALQKGLVLVGLDEYAGVKDHAVIAYDVSDGGQTIKAVNWWSETVQELIEVPFSSLTKAVYLATIDPNIKPTMPFLTVLKEKFAQLLKGKPLLGLIAVILGASLLTGGSQSAQEQKFGQSGVALGYTTTIAAPGISSSIRTIPVSSITLYTGEVISTSTTIFPAYFVINPNGSTQELVECWGLSTTSTSPRWTDCNRGMSALGGPATSTVVGANYSHAAGERFVMTNAPAFFNRFVDIYTDQSVTGTKSFLSDILKIGSGIIGGGQKLSFPNSQPNDPYFRVLGNGATSTFFISFDGTSEFQLNEDGTLVSAGDGISILGGLISVNASTTAGLAFDSNGALFMNASSSFAVDSASIGQMKFDGNGQTYFTISGLTAGFIFYGDGSDGASTTVSGTVALDRDVYYTDFTVVTGTTVNTNGFRIFVQNTLTNNGIIQNNGLADGGAGTAGNTACIVPYPGGSSGTGAIAGYFNGGLDGSQGGVGGVNSVGVAGLNGSSAANSIFAALTASSGGAGGATTAAGGCSAIASVAGGTGGTNVRTVAGVNNIIQVHTLQSFSTSTGLMSRQTFNSSGGGGGGGAGVQISGVNRCGGGGGGSGGSAGPVWIAARLFVNNYQIKSVGSAGGAGGAGFNCGSGGGGGAGGSGGPVFRIYNTLTETSPATTTVNGGTAGSGGVSGGAGSGAGTDGTNGMAGKIIEFNF